MGGQALRLEFHARPIPRPVTWSYRAARNSMRRFLARPSAVALVATGWSGPAPMASKRDTGNPLSPR
ncbi:hypothetical protein G6F62_015858 [Rhizopus arrhizus]|nr:hypothetical protein G6F62_015858 [Rhizopus arrhizus]